MKLVGVYTGDTFRNLMRQYSYDRMGRDPRYRRDVFRAVEKRKAEKAKANDSRTE